MFYEHIARQTKEHLATHLKAYLDAQSLLYNDPSDDPLPLVMPVTIDVASLVGGVIPAAYKTLPQYTVDCVNKSFAQQSADNLNEYIYSGLITALVGSRSSNSVDHLIKRHAAVIEQFVREHQFLHQYADNAAGFQIIEFAFVTANFSGALQVEEEIKPKSQAYWVNGVNIEVVWNVAEMGSGQHG